jgi:hypothetical protein
MREFFDLSSNPLFVRYVRSRLRRSAVLPGIVVVAFLSLCIVWINSQAKGPNNPNPDVGSQMFFWFQGILLVLIGGSQVASAIAQMKESGMIDFHRITPVPPAVQTIGIMVGAPIRELVLYVVTLPFALYLAIDGPIGVTNFAKLLLVQFGSTLMYYSLAMITGLTGGKARGASGRFVAILAGLNIMANSFFSIGIYGPTLVTSMPVYREVFFDDEDAPANRRQAARRQAVQQQQAQQQQQFGGPKQNPNQAQFNQPQQQQPEPKKPAVTFYGAPLPLVVQSLLFQASLLTFLFIGASRRIHSARLPLYTKPIALAFLTTLAALTLGSLWDAPTVFLTLGSIYFLVFCSILLTNSITPPLGDVVKGMQRARKLSGSRVPLWSDLAPNKFIVCLFAAVIAAAVSVGLLLAPQPPALGFIQLKNVFSPWPALLVGVLTVLTYGLSSQYFAVAFGRTSRSYFTLFIFFAWIVPVIVGIIALSADIEGGGYVLGISPVVGIAFAGAFGLPQINELAVKIASITPGAICAIMFLALLINEERKLHHDVEDEHAVRRRRKKDHVENYEDERSE